MMILVAQKVGLGIKGDEHIPVLGQIDELLLMYVMFTVNKEY